MSALSRRQVAGAGWAVPVVLVGSAAPSFAASPTGLTDLAIEVADPPTDPDTWDYQLSVPVYGGAARTVVRTRGALSQTITITNVGSVTATDPSGTVLVKMLNYDGSTPVGGVAQVRVGTLAQGWSLTQTGTSSGGRTYQYAYAGTLAPGAQLTLPLYYYVERPFSNLADFTVYVRGTVVDQTGGDTDDNSARIGLVPGFDYL